MGRIKRNWANSSDEMTGASWLDETDELQNSSLLFVTDAREVSHRVLSGCSKESVRPGSWRRHASPHEERFVKFLLIRPIRVQNGWSRPDDRGGQERFFATVAL